MKSAFLHTNGRKATEYRGTTSVRRYCALISDGRKTLSPCAVNGAPSSRYCQFTVGLRDVFACLPPFPFTNRELSAGAHVRVTLSHHGLCGHYIEVGPESQAGIFFIFPPSVPSGCQRDPPPRKQRPRKWPRGREPAPLPRPLPWRRMRPGRIWRPQSTR